MGDGGWWWWGEVGEGHTKWGFPQQRSQTPNFVCQTPNIACQTPSFACQTPNFVCQTHNILCQTLNISCQTPRISKPNTQNPVAFFPIFRSKLPTSWATLPAVWSPRGAPRATDRTLAIVNLSKFGASSAKFPQIDDFKWSVCLHVAQRGQMRGLRRLGPYLSGGVPPSREPRMCPLRQGGDAQIEKK